MAGQSKAVLYEKLDNICLRGYLNVTTLANHYGQPIISNCLWKIGQYTMRGYLNITTWANRYGRPIKSNCLWKIGQYMLERLFKRHPTTLANHYGRPIRSNHFISVHYPCGHNCIWCKFTGPTHFHTISFHGCSSSKVECTDHYIWALSRWDISLNNTMNSVQRIKHWSIYLAIWVL